jgi:YbbR domain-containing protein
MAGIGRSLTNHAGLKALALLAALALWVLVSLQEAPRERPEAGLIEAAVGVEPAWSGAESSDYVVEEFAVVPASLRIAGPANRVSVLSRLATEPIDVAAIAAAGTIEAAVILPDPQLRFVDNPLVRVEVKMRRR